MADTKDYVVTTRKGFTAPSRTRAGYAFANGEKTVVSLTDEQYTAINDDPELVVSEATDESRQETNDEANKQSLEEAEERPMGNHTNVSLGDNSASAPQTAEVAQTGDTAEAQEASRSASSEESAESGDEVTSLVRENSREELNALAETEGVEDPASLNSKQEVAQAIVDKRQE